MANGLDDSLAAEKTALIPASDLLCFSVYATAHAFMRAYRPLLAPLGLTYPQYLVMVVLWERNARTVKEIGEALSLDSGTLTPLLKRLEAAGHVSRSRDESDERRVVVRLTPRGDALRAEAAGIPAALGCVMGLDVSAIRGLRHQLADLRLRLETGDEGEARRRVTSYPAEPRSPRR